MAKADVWYETDLANDNGVLTTLVLCEAVLIARFHDLPWWPVRNSQSPTSYYKRPQVTIVDLDQDDLDVLYILPKGQMQLEL